MTQPTEEIKVICAWCDKVLGVKEVLLRPEMQGVPSHGICQACLEEVRRIHNANRGNKAEGRE